MVDILLVEDNIELANLMQAFLEKEGFSLWHVTTAEDALAWLQKEAANLILLDIMLPGIDGFAFCQSIRQSSDVPIVILSARSDKADQLMGFSLGADDYIKKPVDPDLLCAKVRVLLQRLKTSRMNTECIHSGAIMIEVDAHKVSLRNTPLDLNSKEFDLLLLFTQNAGRTLHKEFLFNHIWGSDSDSEYQTLTVHVNMLRMKIEDDPRAPKRIRTVWGVGYRYESL